MSNRSSELVEISKLNGDFRKNYGRLIGAYLYLRSISAARGRSLLWSGLIALTLSELALLAKRAGCSHHFHDHADSVRNRRSVVFVEARMAKCRA